MGTWQGAARQRLTHCGPPGVGSSTVQSCGTSAVVFGVFHPEVLPLQICGTRLKELATPAARTRIGRAAWPEDTLPCV